MFTLRNDFVQAASMNICKITVEKQFCYNNFRNYLNLYRFYKEIFLETQTTS